MNLEDLQERLREFADERAWEAFHSPKNLSMALSVEAAELVEHFQWLTQHESRVPAADKKAAIAEEIADIQIYLAMIADKLGIDIEAAVLSKIEANATKYPAGNAPLK